MFISQGVQCKSKGMCKWNSLNFWLVELYFWDRAFGWQVTVSTISHSNLIPDFAKSGPMRCNKVLEKMRQDGGQQLWGQGLKLQSYQAIITLICQCTKTKPNEFSRFQEWSTRLPVLRTSAGVFRLGSWFKHEVTIENTPSVRVGSRTVPPLSATHAPSYKPSYNFLLPPWLSS